MLVAAAAGLSVQALAVSATMPAQAEIEKLIQKAENYLNQLSTLKADFSQTTAGQRNVYEGVFYLKRPRKFLWQYHTPYAQKLVSTGGQLFFVDETHGQVTQLPLNHGLAAFLTQDTIHFEPQMFKLINFFENEQTYSFNLALKDADKAGIRQLQLVFRKNPLDLVQISTLDQLDKRTFVTFSDIEKGGDFDPALFDYIPPHYADPLDN